MKIVLAAVLFVLPSATQAQAAVTTRNTNLRGDASTANAAIRLITKGDTIDLISTRQRTGFLHVTTRAGEKGWLWANNVRVISAAARPAPTGPPTSKPLDIAGSNSFAGCGDGLWKHVYKPQRLTIHQACVTVTGVIVDPTAKNAHPKNDHVRHEDDGDTHGWVKLDKQFASMLNAGNQSDEEGNLVFELVCHYTVRQADAKSSCVGFTDHTVIPRPGTHVEIKGTFVQDDNHAHWNEIHPVTSLRVIP
ncbi:MAG TPA: SH3 domain-containing protein [Gemmatimonadaceae bacterium]|nr:SH3 domain-containing protein [Gemmatimonadaceae bacterium]